MQEEIQFLETPDHFDFPFPPYNIQHDFMKNLYTVLEHKKLGIFESPTGTGKSLSIICGALRWLKDHNDHYRLVLLEQIQALKKKKEQLNSDTDDWLNSQFQEIEITRKLNELKVQQDKVEHYDNKITKLLNKKRNKSKQKWPNKIKTGINSDDIELENNESNIEEDDLLLEDVQIAEDNDEEAEEDADGYEPVKILICSRTHSQLSQLVGEILKSPFSSDVRTISLASRQNYCINPSVNKLKSMSLINEKCLDMQKQKSKSTKADKDGKVVKRQKNSSCRCPFYKQESIDELKDLALLDIHDVEDLVANGKQLNACPYYASRKAAEDAQVVLVPYNTLLHKATREANGIKLKNNVVIIDEAHNLLEALSQMHGAEISLEQLQRAFQQLKSYKIKYSTRFSSSNLLCINQLLFIMTKLIDLLSRTSNTQAELKTEVHTVQNFVITAEIDNYNMFKLAKFCKESRVAQKLHSFVDKFAVEIQDAQNKSEKPKKGLQVFLSSIENKKSNQVEVSDAGDETKAKRVVAGNPFMVFVSFLEALTCSYRDGRIIVHRSDDKQHKLQFLLLNPASQFKDIVQEARAVVVAGGTMKPISEFRERLFVCAGATSDRIVEFSCDHIIPPENILPIILTSGQNLENLLFNYENRFSMGNNLKAILQETCRKVPGGIVVFFPSYKYEAWLWQQLQGVNFGRPVFREPQESGSVEAVLDSYAASIKKPGNLGAMLFSVVGGKLSEGLNFSDDLGRCVIVVGLPYANVNSPELKEKMAYIENNEGKHAGQKFYEALCMKAVNQCIGRAVRHKNDYATVLLVDSRYDRLTTKSALPDWIKRSLRTCTFSKAFQTIEKFFEERKLEANIS